MFLGFVFICGKIRRGAFMIQRRTRGDRIKAELQGIKAELRRRMHDTTPEQARRLKAVVMGMNAYHAVLKKPAHDRGIPLPRREPLARTLRRRSQKDRMTWSE